MGTHRLVDRAPSLDRVPTVAAAHVPYLLRPPTRLSPALYRCFEQELNCPQIEAVLQNTPNEAWHPPPKKLRKMPKSSTLSLAMRGKGGKDNANAPMSPKSPRSPNIPENGHFATPNAAFQDLPQSPASPKPRKDAKNIFSNFSANKSSSRLHSQENTTRQISDQESPSLYSNGRSGSSTPDLGRPVRTPNSDDNRSEVVRLDQRTESGLSNESTHTLGDSSRRNTMKPKKQGLLARSKSIKGDENSGTRTKLNKAPPPQLSPDIAGSWTTNGDGMSLKTAPLEKGQSWRQNMGIGKLRTHSADRQDGSKHAQRDDDHGMRRDRAEQVSLASNSYNESKGATLMSSLGSGARKMGEKMDSARKGVFGKLGRSSSNHESQVSISSEPYVCKIIHKPLIEQTRLTRISTRLEQSRDKTEFWMPALPWRCIDYLNMRGCEEEGLYRVPGSAQQVRYYERKFDTDRDIDLISDPNLNDPNVIGSLFKNWLRQLPDEIFPKAIQAAIQQECQGAKTTPQMLKDELSKLPPFNYYLLFAITCHISLLHSCSEFNKMNYNNLCICFQPAIKIDAFCFQFLILDWRNCWQGCWTEKDFLAEELSYLSALENESQQQQQQQNQTPTPARNGQPQNSSKNKSSQQSPHMGHSQKSTSIRSNSTERNKTSARALSLDRNGRATPPNPSLILSEPSVVSSTRSRGGHGERDSSTERAISSSDSRDGLHARGPSKRAPRSVSTEVSIDLDDGATPTQAQHSRGPSEATQFRLDLRDPPSSPFNIKF
ncbi:Nn.00g099490.m01.CDS01 [Neocucurbitaria sp. VM-36]